MNATHSATEPHSPRHQAPTPAEPHNTNNTRSQDQEDATEAALFGTTPPGTQDQYPQHPQDQDTTPAQPTPTPAPAPQDPNAPRYHPTTGQRLSKNGKPIGRPRKPRPEPNTHARDSAPHGAHVTHPGPLKPRTPAEWTPDQSLPNTRYEKMVQLLIAGAKPYETYQATAKRKPKKLTAIQGASKVFARDDVAQRVAWLRIDARKPPESPENAPPVDNSPPAEPEIDNPLDTDNIENLIEPVLRRALANPNKIIDSATVSALTAAMKWIKDRQDTDPEHPNPEHIVRYLATLAGMEPRQAARALEGLTRIAGRLLDLSGCTPEQLHTAIDRARARDT